MRLVIALSFLLLTSSLASADPLEDMRLGPTRAMANMELAAPSSPDQVESYIRNYESRESARWKLEQEDRRRLIQVEERQEEILREMRMDESRRQLSESNERLSEDY